jgi:hypothetical protein
MRFFRDLLLAALATGAALGMLEGFLRLAHVHYQGSLYANENERGFGLRPNAAGWETDEADVYVQINSDGMRDRERPISRPAHTLRVAVIGSSETNAREVMLDETFEAVMSRDLSRDLEARGWSADVLNFGVPGYTYSQEYLTLQNHVWKYQPQIVILLFSSFPVLKTVRNFYPAELKGAPVYVLQDGKLVPDAITRSTPPLDAHRQIFKNRSSDWMNKSYLATLLNAARVKVKEFVPALKARWQKPSATAPSTATSSAERLSYNPDLPEAQEAWSIAEAIFKAMKEDCYRHGAEFWIVMADQEKQVTPDLAAREAFQKSMNLPSLDAVDQHMERFGAAQGIPVFALAKPLSDYALSHKTYLHGAPNSAEHSGHWNAVGNAQVGHAIAKELEARSTFVRELISGQLAAQSK